MTPQERETKIDEMRERAKSVPDSVPDSVKVEQIRRLITHFFRAIRKSAGAPSSALFVAKNLCDMERP